MISCCYFFFSVPASTKISTLSLHDALPICSDMGSQTFVDESFPQQEAASFIDLIYATARSEEHTSELQSHSDLVCRLLLEKKNQHYEQLHVLERDREAYQSIHRDIRIVAYC